MTKTTRKQEKNSQANLRIMDSLLLSTLFPPLCNLFHILIAWTHLHPGYVQAALDLINNQ
jgi:hypothetical protein